MSWNVRLRVYNSKLAKVENILEKIDNIIALILGFVDWYISNISNSLWIVFVAQILLLQTTSSQKLLQRKDFQVLLLCIFLLLHINWSNYLSYIYGNCYCPMSFSLFVLSTLENLYLFLSPS